jgi:hypothetical protein
MAGDPDLSDLVDLPSADNGEVNTKLENGLKWAW